MSSRQIRLATTSDADMTARFAVQRACDPTFTLDKQKFADDTWNPQYQRQRFLVEVDNVPVATGTYFEWIWWYEPGRFALNIHVHPDYRRQGHGAALYDAMRADLAKAAPAGRIFMCHCREDAPESVRFITQRGFHSTGRDQLSKLDLTTFDAARYAPLTKRLADEGIEIMPYTELVARDPDFLTKSYALHTLIIVDVPAGGERTLQPFDAYVRSTFEYPGFMPELYFVAVDVAQGLYVGQSDLVNENEEREHLGTGYTGVHPAYRRRGLATALKARCIAAAQAQGAKTIATGNWHTNPMLQLNLRLGFQPQPAELWFELHLP